MPRPVSTWGGAGSAGRRGYTTKLYRLTSQAGSDGAREKQIAPWKTAAESLTVAFNARSGRLAACQVVALPSPGGHA